MKNSILFNKTYSDGELSAIADDLYARIKHMSNHLIDKNETLSYSEFIYFSRRIIKMKKDSSSITKYLKWFSEI